MGGVDRRRDATAYGVTLHERDSSSLHARNNPLQGALWARYKRRTGNATYGFVVDSSLGRFELLVLLADVGGNRYAGYLPWAPNIAVDEGNQGRLLEELAEALRERLPAGTLFLRFDVPWESPYGSAPPGPEQDAAAADPRHGPSEETHEPPAPQLRELRMNFTTEHKRLRKAAGDIQPTDSIIVDTSVDDKELMRRMHAKTRYNIRLALRRGVEVYEADPQRELPVWYELYRETMRRKGLVVHDRAHFDALFAAEAETGGEHRASLFFARTDGEPAASVITAQTDGYAIYLYGASNPRYRHLMPAYAVQWRAIQRARERGSTHYDLFGTPSDRSAGHPMHGLHRFKSGFGGRRIRRRGCWDYPLKETEYEALRGQELAGVGFYA